MRISKKILAIALSILMAVSMMPFTVLADEVSGGGQNVSGGPGAGPSIGDITGGGQGATNGPGTAGNGVPAFPAENSVACLSNPGADMDYYYISIEDALSDAQSGATITLVKDVVVTSPIVVSANKDVKLDVNGYSISGNIADADGKKLIQVSGKLEFAGSNGGCIYNTNVAGQGHAACQALTGGTVIVNAPVTFGDSDEIRDNANAVNRGCGIQNNGGTLIINNGYFTSIDANYTTGAWAYAILNCEGDTTINNATVYGNYLHGALGCEDGTLTVNGGSFTVSGANNYYSLYCDGGSITVNGGTFNDNSKYGVNYVGENSSTTITGGDFTYSATTPFVQSSSKSNPVVSGGIYNYEVANEYIASGFKCTQLGANEYTVIPEGDGASLTVDDNISLNIYTDVADHLPAGGDISKVSYVLTATDPDSQSGEVTSTTYDYSDISQGGSEAGDYVDHYVFRYDSAPAQIADPVSVTVNYDGKPLYTTTTSIKKYCDDVIASASAPANLKALAETILDYGKSANDKFDYTADSKFQDSYINTADVSSDLNNAGHVSCSDNNVFKGYAYIATYIPAIRIYLDKDLAELGNQATISATGIEAQTVEPKYELDANGNVTDRVCVDITGILAEDLDLVYTVEFAGATVEINGLQCAKAFYNTDNAANQAFARSIYNYNKAAEAYFG